MEAFDAALAWLETTQSMTAFGCLGAIVFLLFWGILAQLERFSPAVLAALFPVIPALILTPLVVSIDAGGGVETACSSLPGNIEASGTLLTSFDERNIATHCGAPTLRRIVNQTARQPVPAA